MDPFEEAMRLAKTKAENKAQAARNSEEKSNQSARTNGIKAFQEWLSSMGLPQASITVHEITDEERETIMDGRYEIYKIAHMSCTVNGHKFTATRDNFWPYSTEGKLQVSVVIAADPQNPKASREMDAKTMLDLGNALLEERRRLGLR